ncbi:hypothetical protein [Paraburkholderia sp. Ac-20347]|uniref:hypothetical protein n=1 Tax=Paraburkholderia sp. Ac-20347 TaxID=2703892 RepID=UPI001F122AD7|nr:hypothetical protein [Paraburkholderia sp. Ac-20347]
MKRITVLSLLVSASLLHAAAWAQESSGSAAPPLPDEIARQLPKGDVVITYAAGQLTDSPRTDYLVAVHGAGDTREQPTPRPLLIFVQKPDGHYRLAARNDLVVMRADDGGQCDPFNDSADGLVIKNRYFTVQNEVACGAHWTDYITFRFDPKRQDWVFHKEISQAWRLNDKPDGDALIADPATVTDADSKRPVTFSEWRPREP